jgi:hypothetical protein
MSFSAREPFNFRLKQTDLVVRRARCASTPARSLGKRSANGDWHVTETKQ